MPCQSSLCRVIEIVLLGCPWLLYVYPGLNKWILKSTPLHLWPDASPDPTGFHLFGDDVHNVNSIYRRALT